MQGKRIEKRLARGEGQRRMSLILLYNTQCCETTAEWKDCSWLLRDREGQIDNLEWRGVLADGSLLIFNR